MGLKGIGAPSVSPDDKKWQAECDARTLAEAKVIQSDKNRVTAAQKAAKEMSTKMEKECNALKTVAKKKK